MVKKEPFLNFITNLPQLVQTLVAQTLDQFPEKKLYYIDSNKSFSIRELMAKLNSQAEAEISKKLKHFQYYAPCLTVERLFSILETIERNEKVKKRNLGKNIVMLSIGG